MTLIGLIGVLAIGLYLVPEGMIDHYLDRDMKMIIALAGAILLVISLSPKRDEIHLVARLALSFAVIGLTYFGILQPRFSSTPVKSLARIVNDLEAEGRVKNIYFYKGTHTNLLFYLAPKAPIEVIENNTLVEEIASPGTLLIVRPREYPEIEGYSRQAELISVPVEVRSKDENKNLIGVLF